MPATPEPSRQTLPEPGQDNLFLPDFCGIRMVFLVVVIAELAAIVIALAPMETPWTERWARLGLISLFVQWCALSSCALLCLLRRQLRRLPPWQAGIGSYLLILLVIALVSEGAYWLIHYPGGMGSLWHGRFMTRNLLIGLIITGPLLRYFYVQHQWRRQVRAESEARLQALQSRIRPHFLFNSMNTIVSLIQHKPQQAEQVVENLADLFRASLSDARQRVTLADELALCRRYLQIEKLRLGERLDVHWQVDTLPEDARLPALLIQPLIENAIYHGIEPRTDGGTIDISGELVDNQLHITLVNPIPDNPARAHGRGNQLAHQNIRDRLSASFEGATRLALDEMNHHYRVCLSFPYESWHENSDRR
ncbi:sensor histidine kinase [Thiohalophilus sp.]|uniref:sensor histidine kinase n=1 Tax=Thiohalophilus sp. TaxID=3028392 RepID=UPI003976C794